MHLGLWISLCASPFRASGYLHFHQWPPGLPIRVLMHTVSEQSTAVQGLNFWADSLAWSNPFTTLARHPVELHAVHSLPPRCTCVGFLEARTLTALFEADVLMNFVDSLIPVVTRKLCKVRVWGRKLPSYLIWLCGSQVSGGVWGNVPSCGLSKLPTQKGMWF
jgi:hypothetical protein